MQNRDAYETVGVNVGVEDGWLEAHRRWLKRVRGRKAESSREYATFKRGAVGPWHERLPFQVVVLRDGAYGGKESVGIGGKLFVFYAYPTSAILNASLFFSAFLLDRYSSISRRGWKECNRIIAHEFAQPGQLF